jgi:hypothetical protein
MVDAAESFTDATLLADEKAPTKKRRSVVIQVGAADLPDHFELKGYPAPCLILTSPPYPGVYVLYHRWKLQGRWETPAPYWIADCQDGNGQAHYTMHARTSGGLDSYFDRLRSAYSGVASLCDDKTWVVQMVGFNDVATQLPRYLDTMRAVGLEELRFNDLATDDDGRLWRDVPGRRWWVSTATRNGAAPHTAREVVMVFRRQE